MKGDSNAGQKNHRFPVRRVLRILKEILGLVLLVMDERVGGPLIFQIQLRQIIVESCFK